MEWEKTLVIQSYGKPLKDEYKEIIYEIEGKTYRKKLVADAISEYYNNADLLFLLPESLFINDVSDYDELKELILDKDKYKERYQNKIIEQLEKGENGRNIHLIKMYSTGYYDNSFNSENKKLLNVEFDTGLDFIKMVLLKDLFNIINNYEIIIIDLSTGLNYYLPLILDVFRYIIKYQKLSHKLDDNYKIKKYMITTSPPIVQQKTTLNIEDYDPSEFFEFSEPINFNYLLSLYSRKYIIKNKNSNLLIQNINNFSNTFKNEINFLKKILENTRIGYNALENNIPLIFYDNNILSLNEVELEKNSDEILKDIIFKFIEYMEKNETKIHTENDKMIISRSNINGKIFVNTIMDLGIYENIRNIRRAIIKDFKEGNIDKKYNFNDNVATIRDLEKRFPPIYNKLNYNRNEIFLSKDIKKAKTLMKQIDRINFTIMANLIKNYYPQNHNVDENKLRRDFFAHSGLVYSMVMIEKEKDTIYLKYYNNADKIKKWLSTKLK